MTGEEKLDRLIAHLRAHVAELRRLEREDGDSGELEERRLVIARLQNQLAYAVRDVVGSGRGSSAIEPAATMNDSHDARTGETQLGQQRRRRRGSTPVHCEQPTRPRPVSSANARRP